MSEEMTNGLSSDEKLNLILSELKELRGEVRVLDGRLTALETKVETLEQRLTTLDERVGMLDAKVDALNEKVERRLMETRPIWEAVLARLESLENEMAEGFQRLATKMEILTQDVLDVRSAQRILERRADKLEDKLEPKPQ